MDMATYSNSVSWTHAGLMDGLNGLDPNPRSEGLRDYDTGWLTGCEMRKNGFVIPKYYGYCEEFETFKKSFVKGSKVTIVKGTTIRHMGPGPDKVAKRTYTVEAKLANNGSCAYIDHHTGEVVLPKNPIIGWAGAGSYWHEVDINDVPEAR